MARLPRKRGPLQYIANNSTRRATFSKRSRCIFKKASEISILCNVRACAVIYGPGEAEPKVWPNDDEARNILQGIKNLPDVVARPRRTTSHKELLGKRVTRLKEQVRTQMKENRNIETATLMLKGMAGGSLLDLGLDETSALGLLVKAKLNEVRERLATMTPHGSGGEEPVEAAAEAEVGPGGPPEVHAP